MQILQKIFLLSLSLTRTQCMRGSGVKKTEIPHGTLNTHEICTSVNYTRK
jgi:hypothetical protein